MSATYSFSTAESIPKRFRSASVRLLTVNKQNSNQVYTESYPQSYTVFSLPSWLPRIRNRSSSISSCTFSSASTLVSTDNFLSQYISCRSNSLYSELKRLYNNAKTEIDFAIESQGSIYYEGDYYTAHTAFNDCRANYESCMQSFGDTANLIKFRFQWESDIVQLRVHLNKLPPITQSIYD